MPVPKEQQTKEASRRAVLLMLPSTTRPARFRRFTRSKDAAKAFFVPRKHSYSSDSLGPRPFSCDLRATTPQRSSKQPSHVRRR